MVTPDTDRALIGSMDDETAETAICWDCFHMIVDDPSYERLKQDNDR